MDELRPCPFCGGEAHVVTNERFFNVSCPNEQCCGYPTFLKYSTKSIAIKYWNTRTPADVVEVVRCKDCIHRDLENKKCDCSFQAKGGIFPMDDDDFCSYGAKIKI